MDMELSVTFSHPDHVFERDIELMMMKIPRLLQTLSHELKPIQMKQCYM